VEEGRNEPGVLLLREDRGGVARLTLNRPRAYNSLSKELLTALEYELDRLAEDRAARVVVLAGAGEKAFCAGHDLKEIGSSRRREALTELFTLCSRVMVKLTRLPQPVIARVHGIATAAGCQLAATCDLVVASEEARFATPGVKIGLFCSTPMVALSRSVGQKKSMEMLLTGDYVPAEEALRIGLVNKVVPANELDGAIDELAEKISSASPLVVGVGKQAFYRQLEMTTEQAYGYTKEVMSFNATFADAQEGMCAFLEKRKPEWQGR
jgi:enoyl-CoA hydratase/carnithine racemase